MIRKALRLCEARFGKEHPNTVSVMNNLANTLDQLDKIDEAEEMFNRMLAVSKARYGPTHPKTVFSVWNLANFLFERKGPAEALPLFRQVATEAAAYPDDHACRSISRADQVHAAIAHCEKALLEENGQQDNEKKEW